MFEVNRAALAGAVVELVASTRELVVARSRVVRGAGAGDVDRFCGASETFIQAITGVAGLLYPELIGTPDDVDGHAFRDAMRHAALKRGSLRRQRRPITARVVARVVSS
jgi:hypothetical protein